MWRHAQTALPEPHLHPRHLQPAQGEAADQDPQREAALPVPAPGAQEHFRKQGRFSAGAYKAFL